MTFWQAVRESFLEMLFGQYQLEAFRQERKQREACERAALEQQEAAYRQLKAELS